VRVVSPSSGTSGPTGAVWVDVDYSVGTIYGATGAVTATTATSLTIDPSVAAAAFLDNSPDNRADYWWRTNAVDLSGWTAGPATIDIDLILGDTGAASPTEGGVVGLMFHNAASPLTSTAYTGAWIQHKTNGDGVFWAINNWGSLGGNAGAWTARQRFMATLGINAAKNQINYWAARSITKAGDSSNNAINARTNAAPQAFDITGGLWVSVVAGTYQPNGSPPAAAAHTPIAARYLVSPMHNGTP